MALLTARGKESDAAGTCSGERTMRPRIYDDTAARIPVTVNVNGDLHAKARAAGLDVDAIAQRALDAALREHVREEIKQELEEHGTLADALREHYAETENRAAV